jgi:hypothetical protein
MTEEDYFGKEGQVNRTGRSSTNLGHVSRQSTSSGVTYHDLPFMQVGNGIFKLVGRLFRPGPQM